MGVPHKHSAAINSSISATGVADVSLILSLCDLPLSLSPSSFTPIFCPLAIATTSPTTSVAQLNILITTFDKHSRE
jgi:hypothetical protein